MKTYPRFVYSRPPKPLGDVEEALRDGIRRYHGDYSQDVQYVQADSPEHYLELCEKYPHLDKADI